MNAGSLVYHHLNLLKVPMNKYIAWNRMKLIFLKEFFFIIVILKQKHKYYYYFIYLNLERIMGVITFYNI